VRASGHQHLFGLEQPDHARGQSVAGPSGLTWTIAASGALARPFTEQRSNAVPTVGIATTS